jgi:hypothetical protein
METPEQKLKRLEEMKELIEKEIRETKVNLPFKVDAVFTHMRIRPKEYSADPWGCRYWIKHPSLSPRYLDVDIEGGILIGGFKLDFKAQGTVDSCTHEQLMSLQYSRGFDVIVVRKP